MEDNNYNTLDQQDMSGTNLSDYGQANLLQAGKWAKFASICGLVYLGFITLVVLMAGSYLTMYLNMILSGLAASENGGMLGLIGGSITIFYLGILALGYYLMISWLQFGNRSSRAVRYSDQASHVMAWKALRNFFRVAGIFTLAMLVLYLILIVALANSQPEGF